MSKQALNTTNPPQPANTASGETSTTTEPIAKISKEDAPPRCEMCDASVPDTASRTAHVGETKHCACSECNSYVPLGGLYVHWSNEHADLIWNDHGVAWTDKVNVRNAMPWAREAWEKAVGMTVDGVPITKI